jgi:hypothetical protein
MWVGFDLKGINYACPREDIGAGLSITYLYNIIDKIL